LRKKNMKKRMSAGQYRRLAAKQIVNEKTFEVESPSGMVWTLRSPNIEKFLVSGVLPLALVKKMEQAKESGKNDEEAYKELSSDEQIKAIEFSAKIIRSICVNPKIVDSPQNDDELSLDELMPEDFTFLLNWANTSGGSAAQDGLDTFSGK